MIEFTPGRAFEIGDVVSTEFTRSRYAIWWDRIRLWRWDVPTNERRYFKVTATTAGSMWPEVGVDGQAPLNPAPARHEQQPEREP